MSIEANTCELLSVINANKATAVFLAKVGEYLLKTWGIIQLDLSVDQKEYRTEEGSIREGTELFDICGNLNAAAEVRMYLRSCNSGGLEWRRESEFLSVLGSAEELKEYISYKSIDYYDTDPEVALCSFDENGLLYPAGRFSGGLDGVADIREWYCYTPEIAFSSETQRNNKALHTVIRNSLERILSSVCGYAEDVIAERIDDDWEDCGEITLSGSLRFSADRIGDLTDALSGILDEAEQYDDFGITLEINAVPDGEDDYDFAVLSIKHHDGGLKLTGCRI